MAAASLDVDFKEGIQYHRAMVRCFPKQSCTAALYSLLQHPTQVQIRFFITVLQQMAMGRPHDCSLSPVPCRARCKTLSLQV
ncbi:hypothetical protein EDB92DRAFT_1802968 [Lactarius akahatsu]|uniref:RNA-binding protein vts1-like alpha-helical domain-containing protein n=1 Tax=Lactarius akahatsu TaxID=416441 RepID=A0AAD4LAU0_9AGAM|nr:hypothetical protein EDB92DRAFT_1802968 [Lactarius akahatsu]